MAEKPDPDKFLFRDLHPALRVGTASDRYAGWIGQIYSEGRYEGRIKSRTKSLKGESFEEKVLPVESVTEYFEHFSVLELDFTFYRLLLESDGAPTTNFQVLRTYREHLSEGDRVILKAPQAVFAKRLRRSGEFVENEKYLNPKVFEAQFYRPALDLLGDHLAGIVFEQEYQPKKERQATEELAGDLDAFFAQIPADSRYHVELRTESLLDSPYFDMLERHGIGQTLSHWTWLPPLKKQFELGQGRFFNSGKELVIRLITPLRKRYEDTYAQAFPFDKMVEGMMDEPMATEAAEIIWQAIDHGITVNLIANNRAGGNAPTVAREVVNRFLAGREAGG